MVAKFCTLKIAILCMKQWQAVVLPVSLTCLMYAGSLVLKALLLVDRWRERVSRGEELSYEYIQGSLLGFVDSIISVASNVSAWRNYVVVSMVCPLNLILRIYARWYRFFSLLTIVIMCTIIFY